MVDCRAEESGLTKMGFCPSLDERYLTGALDESVQGKEWPLRKLGLTQGIEKVVVWIMDDFPVPNP